MAVGAGCRRGPGEEPPLSGAG